jgi:DNA end-binding protein Ku
VTQDAETEQPLSRGDLVRGYEFDKDRYVILEDEDFDKAKIESSSVMTIDKFVDASEIAPVYFDSSYYVAPDGEAGQDVYAVLRRAMEESGKAGLSRVVIARRERAVVIMPMGAGMVVYTLHDKSEVNDPKALFDPIADETPDPAMVKLATQLIERQEGRFEPGDLEDRYETRLREVIAAKLKGEGIAPTAEPESRGDNVVDLMAALKASLGRGTDSERPAAPKKAAASHPPRKRAAASTARTPRKRA